MADVHENRVLRDPWSDGAVHPPDSEALALPLRAVVNELERSERLEGLSRLDEHVRPERRSALQHHGRLADVVHLRRVLRVRDPERGLVGGRRAVAVKGVIALDVNVRRFPVRWLVDERFILDHGQDLADKRIQPDGLAAFVVDLQPLGEQGDSLV